MNPLLNASHRKLFGISLLAVAALAACGGSDDEPERTPASLQLEKIGGYSAGQFLKSAAEIPAFDAASKRAFVVNAQSGKLDVLDLSDPKNPKKVGEVNGAAVLANGEVNSVAVKNGLVAIAIQAKPKTDAGRIAIYQAADLKLLLIRRELFMRPHRRHACRQSTSGPALACSPTSSCVLSPPRAAWPWFAPEPCCQSHASNRH